MDLCSDEELRTVCFHELAHLRESKATLLGRLLGSLFLFPLIFIKPALNAFGIAGLLVPPAAALVLAASYNFV